ncbi:MULTISPECIES: hypothetical protein [unclassified Ensifer]|uniref:hypothetical protein n=1 Tax=unclassified Ensifer TaxID=2633371 RepID=UPI000761EC8E|nr:MULTISPECIES: hypothetical protein [unclassified Ensifer]
MLETETFFSLRQVGDIRKEKPMKAKPNKTEAEAGKRALCDQMLYGSAKLIMADVGVSLPMLLDRMLTFAAVQASVNEGSPRAAARFRQLADRIEAGALHSLTGECHEAKGLQ